MKRFLLSVLLLACTSACAPIMVDSRLEEPRQLIAMDRVEEGLGLVQAIGVSQLHGSTYLGDALTTLAKYMPVLDRLIVLTDEQAHDGIQPGWAARSNVIVNVAPETFSVRDGLIVSTGVPTGVMRTERMYENFELQLEWRHMVPRGNAGLFVWSDAVTAPGVPFTRSIEVQVLDGRNSPDYTSHGDIFSIHGAVLTPDYTRQVAAIAQQHGLKLHVDGARIFNAAAALNVDVKELTRGADSVTFCGVCQFDDVNVRVPPAVTVMLASPVPAVEVTVTFALG